MPITIKTKPNQYNKLLLFVYILSILLISIKSLALKLYLTPSQSTILIPQLYIDQTIYTQYTIQGTSITIHPALQIIHTNQQLLQISKNTAEQLLVKIQHTVQDLHYMYYVSTQGCIKYSHIKYKVVQDMLEICVDWGKKIQGLEIVNLKQLIVWSNRTVGVLKIDFNSQFPLHQVTTNITYTFIKTDLPSSLPLNLNRCHKQTHISYLCLTNQNLIQFNQTKTLTNDSSLQLVHIIIPPQQLKCIINTCQLQDDIIGLCDCKKGCYNYQIIGNTLKQLIHKQILNSQQIIVMNIAQGGPKTVTMAIASQSILTLMKWSYNQIQVVDSMLLPELNSGQLWDIIVSGDNICLKYRVQVNGNNYAYQHIFIKYDSIRLQYDQINIILSQPYIFTFFRFVYSLSYTGQLSLRMTNPYFLLVNYEEQLRSITIRAFNTGVKSKYRNKQVDNQTVQILIMPAIQGYVYVNQQLPHEVQMNYQYSYPMQLYEIFIGSISKFVYTEQLLPFKDHTHTQQQVQNKQDRQDRKDRQDRQEQYNVRNKTILQNYKDLRILSIYNLLQCVKLESISGGWSFRRYMGNKNSKIYVQQCKSQQTQNNGDFICQIKQIIDSISHHQILNNQANNPKQPHNTFKSNNAWKLVQIQLQQNKILFEIWKKQLSQNQQQIIINTALYCYHFICHHHCYQILPTRYIILSTHNTTVLSITLFNPFSINTTIIQYHLPIQLYPQLQRIKLSNINCQLVSQNIIYRYYKIVFGLHITNNKTIAFILQLRLSNFLKEKGMSIILSRVMQFQYYVMYFRIYSDYLYSFNSSHIIKSSLMTANGERLYTHVLQYNLGNPLQLVRNLGQYMLLVYQHSYRLLDLSGELISLIIDDKENGNIKQFGNVGVYDIILFGTNTILLGINNMMRAYDRSLSLTIGGYLLQDGCILTQHLLTLSAVPLLKQNPEISQNFNLTISYQTSQVQIRGKAIKLLRDLPYSAQNTTLVIFQTMFTGPIQQYYIADIYEGAIVLLNHIQKLYDANDRQINRWISVNTTTYIIRNNYKIMLKCPINVAKNIQNIQQHKLLYTNNTHFIIVSLKKQQIQQMFQLSQAQQVKYGQFMYYFEIEQQRQQDNLVIIYNKNCVVYLNYSSQYRQIKIVNLKNRQGVQIIQAAIAGQAKQTKLYLILNQIYYNNKDNIGRLYQRTLYTIDFYKNHEQLIYTNLSHFKYFTVIYKTIIWVCQSQNKINQQPILDICIKKQNNQNTICQNLMTVIPQQYYLTQLSYYYKLIPISTFQQQNITIVRLLLLSKFSHAYHIDLILKYKQQDGKIINSIWEVTNCYVSLNQYMTMNFIGVFVNGTGYDYFILQYYKLEENNQESQTIIGFYRVNDEFNRYCGYVGGWYTVKDGQVANIVHVADQLYYPFIPHQSIMFTTLQVYHLYKNLTFVLNYDKPPKVQYSVITARNPLFYKKFYSKLIYQADPDEKYLWVYCWIGFVCVGICLGILKIISVMIDRGIITINKSLSEDDDSGGSPRVTVHYSGSGGMLTEQNSYKSLQSQQIS